MDREQLRTGSSPEQVDQQQASGPPMPIALKDGGGYYGLLSNHFMCTTNKRGQFVSKDEIPDVERKYCRGCGRSLLPWPQSGRITVGQKVILGLQSNCTAFGYAHEVIAWETCEGVRVRWERIERFDWLRSDELMLYSEWEKENPARSMRDFWSEPASEQASIRRMAGIYLE
jgi:hypothetical protein